MGDEQKPVPEPTPTPAPISAPKVKAVKNRGEWRKSRWWRRAYIAVLAILAVGVVSRLVVMVALPPVIRAVALRYGLTADYEKMELYLLNGDVGIWHFTLTPTEGGNKLVQSDYTRLHISTLDLLMGRLTVRRLESEGVDLRVDRRADGTIPLLQRFSQWTSRAGATPAATQTTGAARQIDLSSPLEIDAFRLTNIRAHLVDAAVSPAVDAVVEVNLRLTDLDSTERPTHFEMDLTASPVLDLLHVDGTGTAVGKSLEANLRVEAKGIHPQPAQGYLNAMGIRPISSTVSLEMNAYVKTHPIADPEAIAANVLLQDMTVTADGEQAASLETVSVFAPSLSYTAAHIAKVYIDRGNSRLRRDARGETGVAGLQVIEPVVLVRALRIPITAALRLIPQHWTVGGVVVRNLKLIADDEAVAPAAELALRLNELSIESFSPEKPKDLTKITGSLTAPGIAGTIQLDGNVGLFAVTKHADMNLKLGGIRPDALRPYFDEWGLQSDYSGGTFDVTMSVDVTPGTGGKLMTNATLSNLALKDGAELLTLNLIDVKDAAYDPEAGRLHINAINVSGPKFSMGREVGGAMSSLGLHTKPRPAQAARGAEVAGAGVADAGVVSEALKQYFFSLPKLQVDQFVWKTGSIGFDDQALTPNPDLEIKEAGVELSNLNIDFDPTDAAAAPGKVHAWVFAPDESKSVIVDGTVSPSAEGMVADLTVDGKGITSKQIAGYFDGTRIRPVLQDGSFHFTTNLAAKKTAAGIGATVGIKDFSYKNGEENLLTVDLASAGGVSLKNNELMVEKLEAQRPSLWVSREADGSIVAAGIRILPLEKTGKASDRLGEIYQSPAQRDAAPVEKSAKEELVSILKEIDLQSASVQWTDRLMQPEASAHLTVTANMQDVVLGKSQTPAAKLTATVQEDSALKEMTVNGTVTPSLQTPGAVVTVDAKGIQAGTLAPYLGQNVRVNLKDGRLHAEIDAGLTPNPDGGDGAHLLVSHLDYRDGDAPLPLCQLDALRLTASRFDPSGKIIAIDEIGVDGLNVPARRCKDGTIQLLGVNLSRPEGASAQEVAPLTQAANVGGVGIANLAAVANEKYPLVTLEKLDVSVKEMAISDEYRPDAVPLRLTDLRLSNSRRIEILGDNPQTRPAVELDLTGAANPLIGSMTVHAAVKPFADPAEANLDAKFANVHGSGVTDLFPALKSDIDGSTLDNGQLAAHLNVQFKQPRADPLAVDFSKDFSVQFSLKDVALKDGATGNALAGLGEIASEEIQVQPKHSTVIVRDLELTKPSANVYRDGRGIHLLGVVVKPEAWQNFLYSQSTAASPTTAEGEIAVNKLLITGLDFNFEDRVCSPPLEVPLNGLDAEVRGLSSRMAAEDKSVRFSALLNAGKVSLPKRGSDAMEQRDLFSQAEASGIFSLYPFPKGWVKTSINALDLAALQGEGRQEGVNLGGGTFDATADLRLNGDGSMQLRSRLSFTDLELTEPANGPIVTYLKVGSPLNVVIAALQDQDGSITIPIDVPIRSGHISGGDIALAETGALASVVATAAATTPLKATDSVLALFGNQKVPKNEQPVTLNFDPADPSLSPLDVAALRTLLKQAQDDPTLELALHHVFGGGDKTRAAILANPSPQDSEDLAKSLRQKRIALLAARQAAAQRVAAQIASGYGADSNTAIEQLRNIDTALATTENAMDEMYDMQRPGAERQKDRRTRAACLEIGQDRLLAVRDALLASGIPGIEEKIKVTHATLNETTGNAGGQVVIVLSHKKNQ